MYVHEIKGWPNFTWDEESLTQPLAEIRHRQGRIMGRMEGLGFSMRAESMLNTLTEDVLKSSAIEGEILIPEQVRSSIARRLGMEIGGLVSSDRNVDGVVEMMLDATQNFTRPLTDERLFGWHAALFPTGRSGINKIVVGKLRTGQNGPMQVVSGAIGREKVHFEAPDARTVNKEMLTFLKWYNHEIKIDPVLKAAIAHFWYVTIHPFEDGNGRIARAIADMQLARADGSSQRFYSMSAQIRLERNAYYQILENSQKGSLDITKWLEWFLACLGRALDTIEKTLKQILHKTQFFDAHINTELNNRQRLMLHQMLDGFDGKLTTTKWAKITKCSPDTALRDIQDLMNKKILLKEAGGSKNTNYVLIENL